MENASKAGIKSLQYRLFVNEGMGIMIFIAVTVIVSLVLFFLKNSGISFIVTFALLGLFVLQTIIIYFISLMQYKNLQYTIGQNAVSFQRGTFGVDKETIPFEKIKSSQYDQSFMQRLFSVGDISIEQDGETYTWENIDSKTASLITDSVSAKGDVQPIVVSAPTTPTPPASNQS